MADSARQEDFLFAEHVLRRGFSTEEQVEECLKLLDRLRGEMELDESLENILLKKGYLATAQAQVIRQTINPQAAGTAKNQIEGYRLIARLGSGAMGSVYRAQHLKLDIPVALKVLRVDLAKSKTQIERLKREAQLAARLNHPNIVRSLDVGESNGFHYFAMEFVDGATVRHLLRRGRIREKEALRILRDVVRGLEHAHADGVVHRDIKPGNIMMMRDGTVKLGDFGLARGQEPSDLTLDHASIGTPQYVAPEQVRRGADATPRSDLFSCGATLYHMVTGRPPFSGDTLGEIISKAVHCEFDPPEQAAPDLGIDTVYLIHRLMRKSPRERYASASDLLQDLERVEKGERIAPAEFKGDYQAYLHRRLQRRMLVGASAAAVIALCTFYVVHELRIQREEQARYEFCAAVNGTAAGVVEEVEEVVDLKEQLDRMEASRGEQECEADWISDLDLRIAHTEADIVALERAAAVMERTKEENVPYRDLAGELIAIRTSMPGPGRRLEAFRRQLRELSDQEATERWERRKLWGWRGNADATVSGLKGFLKELDKRYLPIGFRDEVKLYSDAIEGLHVAFAKAERDHVPQYEQALLDHRFNVAAGHLERFHAARAGARRKVVDKGVPATFLEPFPETSARAAELLDEEDRCYTRLERDIEARLAEGRPDVAEELLEEFLPKAHSSAARANQQLVSVRSHKKRELERQIGVIQREELRFYSSLRLRNYASASQRVIGRSREVWILEAQERFDRLHKRAIAVRGLMDRFLEGVGGFPEIRLQPEDAESPVTFPGNALRTAPGEDPDRFEVAVDKGTHTVYLRDFPYDTLLAILAFDPGKPRDVEQRGYFHFAESFRDERDNPPKALAMMRQARKALRDPDWERVLDQRIDTTEKHIQAEEDRAVLLNQSMEDARDRKDYSKAAALCQDLMRLSWTSYVDKAKLNYLKIRMAELNRLSGHESRREESGLPPDNFAVGNPESGDVIFRYTGEAWYPDENRVPEGLAGAERETWLDERARKFWHDWFKDKGRPASELEDLYQRARHQLLDWNDLAVAAPGGGYTLDQEIRHNQEHWWTKQWDGTQETALRSHLRPDRNWSIEFTVRWHHTEPVYFAVRVGRIQAGFGRGTKRYKDGEEKPEDSGGVSGAAIFEEEDMVEAPQSRGGPLSDYHWKDLRIDKHLRDKKGAPKSPIARFVEDVPYRIRFERVGPTVRYYATPLKEWEEYVGITDKKDREGKPFPENALHLERKFGAHSLKRNMERDGAFHFFGRVRYTLTDVEVRGFLK